MNKRTADPHLVQYVMDEFFRTMVMYQETRAAEQGVDARTAHTVAVNEVESLLESPKYLKFQEGLKRAAEMQAIDIEDWYMRHQTFLTPLDETIDNNNLGWMFWDQTEEVE